MSQGLKKTLLDGLLPTGPIALEVKQLPSDESCLFHAVACALEPQFYTQYEQDQKRVANSIRKLVSHYLHKIPPSGIDPQSLAGYNTPTAYAEYIENEKAWGTTLEMSILGDHYNVQFCIMTLTDKGVVASLWPPNKPYTRRIYLLNNSVKQESKHYDMIVANSNGTQYFLLPANENNIYYGAANLAEQIRQTVS